jgi:hypothetical protein
LLANPRQSIISSPDGISATHNGLEKHKSRDRSAHAPAMNLSPKETEEALVSVPFEAMSSA